VSGLLSVDDYLASVLADVQPLAPVELALIEAVGGVLAETVTAAVSLPPFDNSAMDGYAVVAGDVAGASDATPVRLSVIGDISAGDRATLEIRPGLCTRIMTGAPMPAGADCVVPVEATDGGTETVTISSASEPGHYIRRVGEDVIEGRVVMEPGTRLGATQLALLAGVGRARVLVRPRPRVVVMSTGNELIEPGLPLLPGQIWDSNSFALTVAATQAGAAGHRHGSVGDDPRTVRGAIEDHLAGADAVITSGGVSMGARDVVKEALTGVGSMRFEKIAMRPGKPQGFGLIDGHTPIFTLPGNPVSAYVSFQVFVLPALRKMQGLPADTLPTVIARLAEPVSSPAGLRHFLRGVLDYRAGEYHVGLLEGQGSHQMASLADSNALLVIPEDVTELPAGSPVAVMRLP
jgi:molybdopterin molybdotransferase